MAIQYVPALWSTVPPEKRAERRASIVATDHRCQYAVRAYDAAELSDQCTKFHQCGAYVIEGVACIHHMYTWAGPMLGDPLAPLSYAAPRYSPPPAPPMPRVVVSPPVVVQPERRSTHRREPSPCPECRGPAETDVYSEGAEYEHRYANLCPPCSRVRAERQNLFRQCLDEHFPSLSPRTRNTVWRACDDFATFDAFLAASDDDLLCLRNLGQKSLAEIRAVVPEPIPIPVNPHLDAWREHAAMMALVGG